MAEGKFGPGRGFGEGLFADGGESVRALVEEVVQALIGEEAAEHFGAQRLSKRDERPGTADPDGDAEAEAAAGPERVVLSLVPGAVADLGAGAGGDPGGDGDQGGLDPEGGPVGGGDAGGGGLGQHGVEPSEGH